jgi:hypothetical protein
MAAQQELGLLSERRGWVDPRDSAGAVFARPPVSELPYMGAGGGNRDLQL